MESQLLFVFQSVCLDVRRILEESEFINDSFIALKLSNLLDTRVNFFLDSLNLHNHIMVVQT